MQRERREEQERRQEGRASGPQRPGGAGASAGAGATASEEAGGLSLRLRQRASKGECGPRMGCFWEIRNVAALGDLHRSVLIKTQRWRSRWVPNGRGGEREDSVGGSGGRGQRTASSHSGPLASSATNLCHLSSQASMATFFSPSDRALYLSEFMASCLSVLRSAVTPPMPMKAS